MYVCAFFPMCSNAHIFMLIFTTCMLFLMWLFCRNISCKLQITKSTSKPVLRGHLWALGERKIAL
jgi:hypothetical protein